MAVIKHIASKNADYGESERYLIFQHNEYTQKPILDDEGHMILRDEYYLDGLNCDPFTFASECQELNSYYHKNKKFNEIKSHHYIISFDPKDKEECGLTGERAQQLGLTFAKKNFSGHQALVCTHTDGHNESGNIHVHIVINSLRKYDVPQEPYMEFDCESKAGYKHHLTLKEKSARNKIPSMKALYAEKDRLIELRDTQRENFSNHRDYERELHTVSANIDIILGKSHEQEQFQKKEPNL